MVAGDGSTRRTSVPVWGASTLNARTPVVPRRSHRGHVRRPVAEEHQVARFEAPHDTFFVAHHFPKLRCPPLPQVAEFDRLAGAALLCTAVPGSCRLTRRGERAGRRPQCSACPPPCWRRSPGQGTGDVGRTGDARGPPGQVVDQARLRLSGEAPEGAEPDRPCRPTRPSRPGHDAR